MSRPARTAAAVVTAAVLAGLLSACYLHSHEYVLTPEFSGLLLKAGAPMRKMSISTSTIWSQWSTTFKASELEAPRRMAATAQFGSDGPSGLRGPSALFAAG
jgi:hypothetical protein